MKKGYEKYRGFEPINIPDRTWPDKTITKAPTWCSVDLRDGNQALVDPMNLQEKLEFFTTLVNIGFKEIEVGFPSASETEYEILRTLIEGNYIPDDVTIQVLVQAREHLIRKTFEAIDGAKNVIVHFYNSTSTLQRKVVFKTDMQGVIDIAIDGAKLIYELTEEEKKKNPDMNIRFEYSPESFSGTEMDNAVEICRQVQLLTVMLTRLNISAAIFQIVMQLLFRFILITTGVQVLPQQNLGFLQVLTELRAHFLATEKELVMLILLPWHLICGPKVLTLSLISTI